MTGNLFSSSNGNFKSSTPRCHTTHKPLKLGNGTILGASCGSPRKDYDIYIGLCYTMEFKHQNFPWENDGDPVIEFLYKITDGCAPGSPAKFKKMIAWVAEQLEAGKKVHVGCIGGHGRTGTFLAALVGYMGVSDDPIKYVREHHCKKAVESESQVKFLMKHFGAKKAKPSKTSYSGTQTGRYGGYSGKHWDEYDKSGGGRYRKPKALPRDKVVPIGERISHMEGKGSIWG